MIDLVEQSLAQKINKVKVNIKACHVTYNVLRDLHLENLNIDRLYIEQVLKVITLQYC